jgi:prepilin-type N-terminal cleavage/methylation domain-containing protein
MARQERNMQTRVNDIAPDRCMILVWVHPRTLSSGIDAGFSRGSAARSLVKVPLEPENAAERNMRGFSLMEVLVGITIVGIVYATLFSLMSTSLKNIGRIEEREKLTRLGQMKLNELVLSVNQGKIPAVSAGRFDDKYSWRFQIEPVSFGGVLNSPRDYAIAMIRLVVFWQGVSQQQNEYSLETFTWFSKKP